MTDTTPPTKGRVLESGVAVGEVVQEQVGEAAAQMGAAAMIGSVSCGMVNCGMVKSRIAWMVPPFIFEGIDEGGFS